MTKLIVHIAVHPHRRKRIDPRSQVFLAVRGPSAMEVRFGWRFRLEKQPSFRQPIPQRAPRYRSRPGHLLRIGVSPS